MILQIATIRIKLTFEHDYNLYTEYFNKIVTMYKTEDTAGYDFELKTLPPADRPSTRYTMESRNDALYMETEDFFIFEKESWVSTIYWKDKVMTAMFFIEAGAETYDRLLMRSLKLLVSLLVLQKGGLPCHCSAVAKEKEYGLLFSGPSNEGKTTIALFLHRDWELFNDEYNIIMPGNNGYRVYSTPFTTPQNFNFCSLGSVPIRKLFILRKGSENKVESMSIKQKYLSILESVYTFPTSKGFADLIMRNVEKVSQEILVEKLYFKLGSNICEEIKHFI